MFNLTFNNIVCSCHHDFIELLLTRRNLANGSLWLSWCNHFQNVQSPARFCDICVSQTTTNVCYNPNSVFSSIIAYHRFCDSGYTTDATANSTWVPEYIPVFFVGSCCSICSFLCSVLWIILCLFPLFFCPLCCLYLVIYGLWLLMWYMASDYSFDIWLLITHLIFVKLFFGMYFVVWMVVD